MCCAERRECEVDDRLLTDAHEQNVSACWIIILKSFYVLSSHFTGNALLLVVLRCCCLRATWLGVGGQFWWIMIVLYYYSCSLQILRIQRHLRHCSRFSVAHDSIWMLLRWSCVLQNAKQPTPTNSTRVTYAGWRQSLSDHLRDPATYPYVYMTATNTHANAVSTARESVLFTVTANHVDVWCLQFISNDLTMFAPNSSFFIVDYTKQQVMSMWYLFDPPWSKPGYGIQYLFYETVRLTKVTAWGLSYRYFLNVCSCFRA